MLELAILIISIGSVITNLYLVKKIGIDLHVQPPQIFVEVVEKPIASDVEPRPTQVPLVKDESQYAWKNGKVETEPVQVGWRPKNNPPPSSGPLQRPSGFVR